MMLVRGDQLMDNDEANSLDAKIPVLYARRSEAHASPRTVDVRARASTICSSEKYYNYAVRSQFVPDRYNAYPLPERNGMVSAQEPG